MKTVRENAAARALLVAVLAVNLWALRAELHSGGVDLNDHVSHFPMIARMAQAIEHHTNPLDFWSPEWSFGFPVIRVYQPLAHILVALAYLATGKAVSLVTVFVWARFLTLALFPLSVFVMLRCFELPPLTAAAGACLAPLISTPQLYGLEYESYVWAGFGLFPQGVAAHFLLLSLGCGFRALRGAGSATLAGILLACACLCQFIYGYMGALSLCLLALVAIEVPRILRLQRILWIGLTACALSLFQLVPVWLDRALINPPPADQAWKSDSFGPSQVLQWMVTGQLLDNGRLPVLSLLAAAGIVTLWLRHFEPRGMGLAGRFALSGAGLWLLLFCGRPLWGPVLYLLGITREFHLHRVLAGAQIFLLVLAAIGLAEICRRLARRLHVAAAALAALALFYPMLAERARYLELNRTRMQRTIDAMRADRPALDALLAALRRRGGRAFAGLATPSSWGPSFRVGAIPMYHVLTAAGVPTVGYLNHTLALTSPVMLEFDERNPTQYRLFDIRAFIVPAGTKYPVPAFLKPGPVFGRFQIFDTPSDGSFDLVDVDASLPLDRDDFAATNIAWLTGGEAARHRHIRFDLAGARAAASRLPCPHRPPGKSRPRAGTPAFTWRSSMPPVPPGRSSNPPGIPIGRPPSMAAPFPPPCCRQDSSACRYPRDATRSRYATSPVRGNSGWRSPARSAQLLSPSPNAVCADDAAAK